MPSKPISGLIAAVVIAITLSIPAHAATERIPCKSTEATVASFGGYIAVRCPTTGRTLSEGQEVHFEGDKRDARAVNGKLVWLDGPLGGAAGPDPRVAELAAKLADIKAKLQAIVGGL